VGATQHTWALSKDTALSAIFSSAVVAAVAAAVVAAAAVAALLLQLQLFWMLRSVPAST